ncbi:MAG: hypothetical protein H5T96_09585 [Tissierellales bacterium]|nr:hypothetical protein [Tissierellales bacterium]
MNWRDNLKEGPTEVVIPEQRYNSCRECRWYDYMMVKSGFHPEYRHNCNYPNINKLINYGGFYGGNLQDNKTPDWCPILNKDEKES